MSSSISVVRGQDSLPNVSGGSQVVPGGGQFSDAFVSQINAPYFNLVYNGIVFSTTYAAASLAAPSATALGAFGLWNPIGSGKNLVLLDAYTILGVGTAQATPVVVGLCAFGSQTPSSVSAGNAPQNCLIGSGNVPQAKPYTAATIVGGSVIPCRTIAAFYADLVAATLAGQRDTVDGLVIVPPGCGFGAAAFAGTVADVQDATISYTWAELELP